MIPPERNNLGSLADFAIRTETVLVREGIVVASRGAKELRRDDDVHLHQHPMSNACRLAREAQADSFHASKKHVASASSSRSAGP